MRISLLPGPRLSSSPVFNKAVPSASELPLAFIDDEPFIIELQGSLELPGGEGEASADEMNGVSVGRLDLDEPHKPILRIAHHRLEGKLVTLSQPFAILKTAYAPEVAKDDEGSNESPKRRKKANESNTNPLRSPGERSDEVNEKNGSRPQAITIVGLVRRKMVFSKRPEPIITLASDADYEQER